MTALVLALAGCSTTPAPAPQEDQAPTETEVEYTPTPTPTPDAPPTSSATISSTATLVGVGPRVVVLSDLASGSSVFSLYGPGTTTGGTIDLASQWDQSEIEGQWTAVQSDPDGSRALALVTLEKTPNEGLNAGGKQLVIRSYDIDGTPLAESAVPVRANFSQNSLNHVGLLGDTLVLLDNGLQEALIGSHSNADAVNVETGELLWSATCGDGYASTTPLYSGPGRVAVGCDYNGILGLDLATGQTVWSATGGGTQSFAFDSSAPGVLNASEYAGSADVTIDLLSGVTLDANSWQPVIGDPVSGLHAMGTGTLSVYDPTQQTTVLSIDSATISQLGDFMPLSAFDGRLTFLASDGLNVASLTTGAPDPASPAKSATKQGYANVVADAGSGWVLLGSISAGWDPGSWVNTAPLSLSEVIWAVDPDGALTWDDLPSISSSTGQ
ncbi:hypothetical protein [Herbiconiux liukaitaii]|uniref:hypothetical protein n=1 Tax=Herbiconiux liukaitaii TaxID=3342799 RepID=UPI0035B96540